MAQEDLLASLLNISNPPFIIAEIADNHSGSLEVAKRLALEARIAGAHIAKFQYHLPDIEMVPHSIEMWDGDLYSILKRNLLGQSEHKALKEYCEEIGIKYLCTPFCIEASDRLEELGVEAFKVGSGEMQNLPMIRHIARKRKLMIISTGMSTLEEVDETVRIVKEERCPFVLMYCVSEYPPAYSDINLGLLRIYRERFNCEVGLSDHSPTIWTAIASVALGARLIEKHFTLNKNLSGPDHFISLVSNELSELCISTKRVWEALGVEKRISDRELIVRDWAYHSLVLKRDLKAGELLLEQDVAIRRPGSGIPAKYFGEYIGRRLKLSLRRDTILQSEYFLDT